MNDKKLLTLVSLTPKQVYEYQVRLKQECDSKRLRKKIKEKGGSKIRGGEIERRIESEKIKDSEKK